MSSSPANVEAGAAKPRLSREIAARDAIEIAAECVKSGQIEEAERILNVLLGRNPKDPGLIYMLGTLMARSNRNGAALVLLAQAIDMLPDLSAAYANLGGVLRQEGHRKAAIRALEKAVALDEGRTDLPAFERAAALCNLSGCYVNEGEPVMAVKYGRQAVALDPDNAIAHTHLAMGLLELGQYREGWEHYRWRWERPEQAAAKRPFTCPRWDGSRVGTLAIHGEQGLGDEILFASCVPDAMRRADRVVLECNGRLIPLMERSFGIPCYEDSPTLLQDWTPDAYAPLGDLPGHFRNSPGDFSGSPFLRPDPARVAHYRDRLREAGARYGVAWMGGKKQTFAGYRSIDLKEWAPILKKGCVSVQYGPWAAEEAASVGLPHWDDANASIDEQAALIAACDAVVTVCQTAVHLAGALGTKCLVLVPSRPAWRYGVQGTSMPWYSSVKLLRQKGDGWGHTLRWAAECL